MVGVRMDTLRKREEEIKSKRFQCFAFCLSALEKSSINRNTIQCLIAAVAHDSWDMKLFTLKCKKDSSLTLGLTISKSSWFIELVIFLCCSSNSSRIARLFLLFICSFLQSFSVCGCIVFLLLLLVSLGNVYAHVFK